jgi:uncharacterized protein YqhQ
MGAIMVAFLLMFVFLLVAFRNIWRSVMQRRVEAIA